MAYLEATGIRTFGVEEELLLFDPRNWSPIAASGTVVRLADQRRDAAPPGADQGEPIKMELQCEQVEIGTPPCSKAGDLLDGLRTARAAASAAAAGAGAVVAALGASPTAVRPTLNPDPRYRRMAEAYAQAIEEELTCGCHVHVQISCPEEGVAVLDRIRPWLPPLLALSGNSPYWQGRDTGHDSWRQQVWGRWPTSGPTERFGDVAGYDATVGAMMASGGLVDEGMVYFDARLSRRYPTVEIRVPDVCLDAEDSMLMAMLVRGLVETEAAAWRAGTPPDPVRLELLRLACWRASRFGLRGALLDPVTWRPEPAEAAVRALLDHAAEALAAYGDLDAVECLVRQLLARGNGAGMQRSAFARTGEIGEVVAFAVERTAGRSAR
jgi:YbdK family carboxylate-amine ligase